MAPIIKDLWILRHGQATHNPRAEVAYDAGCSMEQYLQLMREDDEVDSKLTEHGRQQAQTIYNLYKDYWETQQIQLVVSSPLSRAIQTADLALPPSIVSNRVLYEDFREFNGYLLNAKRKSKTEIAETFPHWTVDLLEHDDDIYWTEELEGKPKCGERGYQALQWLLSRDEDKVLLVAHGGILRITMAEHECVTVHDERTSHTPENGGSLSSKTPKRRLSMERFDNCELRRYRLKRGDEDSDGRSTIQLTEVDFNLGEC